VFKQDEWEFPERGLLFGTLWSKVHPDDPALFDDCYNIGGNTDIRGSLAYV
jgi:hypothetical protein